MQLSIHFTLDEFTHSQTAARAGIDNDPPIDVLKNLQRTAQGLELVRTYLGSAPIHVSSGYRSPALNAAVKGAANSQHLTGQAVDFTCPSYGEPYQIVAALRESSIPYDQVICEFGRWVHISFSDMNRKQALIIDQTGTRAFA